MGFDLGICVNIGCLNFAFGGYVYVRGWDACECKSATNSLLDIRKDCRIGGGYSELNRLKASSVNFMCLCL
jgi:hypothetical protein